MAPFLDDEPSEIVNAVQVEEPSETVDAHENEAVAENAESDSALINEATGRLAAHVRHGRDLYMHEKDHKVVPLFYIEIAPPPPALGVCSLPGCDAVIAPGAYRLAVVPGIGDPAAETWSDHPPDLYHLECFERIADFSDFEFHYRVVALTRLTYGFRGLNSEDSMTSDTLVDGGAEQLLFHWARERLVASEQFAGFQARDIPMDNLLLRAGSSTYIPQETEYSAHEQELLESTLAPIESDGPEDAEEWDLFEAYYSPAGSGVSNQRHGLSHMMYRWFVAKAVVTTPDHLLTEGQRRIKEKMSEKEIRAIRRLSAVSRPEHRGVNGIV